MYALMDKLGVGTFHRKTFHRKMYFVDKKSPLSKKNLLSMKCLIYEMSYVLSMKCPIYEMSVLSMKCLIYEMSYP